jgi:hypothetical protein
MRRPVVTRHLSPTFVVACGALLFSLSGTGLADIAQLGRNTVGSPQLRPGAVTTPKIRGAAVTTVKLRNGAVTLDKLAANARVPGPRGAAGPPGTAGPPGPPGAPANLADGSITTAKLANNAVTSAKLATDAVTADKLGVFLKTTSVSVGGANHGGVNTPCGSNGKIMGGGAWWQGAETAAQAKNLHIVESYPDPPFRWSVIGYNGTGAARTLNIYLVCVRGA